MEICSHMYTCFLPQHLNQVWNTQRKVFCCFCAHRSLEYFLVKFTVDYQIFSNLLSKLHHGKLHLSLELLMIPRNLMLITKIHKPLNKQTNQRNNGLACYTVLDDLFFSMLMGIAFCCPPVI